MKTKNFNHKVSDVTDPVPPIMKAIAWSMLILIPILGYLILRSDPIIYSNNIQNVDSTLKQVKKFAAFIEQKPEMAVRMKSPEPTGAGLNQSEPKTKKAFAREAKEEAQLRVAELAEIWREHPPEPDQIWRNQVDKLFDIVESSGSEEALDLIQPQILAARVSSDDLNRTQSEKWFARYIENETRPDKIRQMSEYFKEKVLERVEKDERVIRLQEQSGH